jgi:hypothetical protein
VNLVITGFTLSAWALTAEAYHLFMFVLSVHKLPICGEAVFESLPGAIPTLVLRRWHTNPSNLSDETFFVGSLYHYPNSLWTFKSFGYFLE